MIENNDLKKTFSIIKDLRENSYNILSELKNKLSILENIYKELLEINNDENTNDLDSLYFQKKLYDLQIINSWSTMTEKDGYSSLHSHKNSYISGCYYFTNTSELQLKNPNWNQWFLEPLTKFDDKNPATYGFVNFQPKQKVIILLNI